MGISDLSESDNTKKTSSSSPLFQKVNSRAFITIKDSNSLYITNYENNTVKEFDSMGNMKGYLKSPDNLGFFNGPTGIASDKSGNIYVAECLSNSIKIFDNDGKFKEKLDKGNVSNAHFDCPEGITIDLNHNLYVTNRNNPFVDKISVLSLF
jgi:tripartite motif-containing protein 71